MLLGDGTFTMPSILSPASKAGQGFLNGHGGLQDMAVWKGDPAQGVWHAQS